MKEFHDNEDVNLIMLAYISNCNNLTENVQYANDNGHIEDYRRLVDERTQLLVEMQQFALNNKISWLSVWIKLTKLELHKSAKQR